MDSDLLKQVYRNPEDLALRRVLADALHERGDPRGEFIALQCTKPTPKVRDRLKTLYRENADAWLSILDLNKSRMHDLGLQAFEAGFLSVAIGSRVNSTLAEWATVRQLFIDDGYQTQSGLVSLLNGKRCLSLRSVFWLRDESLLKVENPRLTEVGISCFQPLAAGSFDGLPSLRTLWLQPRKWGKRLIQMLPANLERLHIYLDTGVIGADPLGLEGWRKALRNTATRYVSFFDNHRVRPELQSWELRFDRAEAPAMDRGTLIWHGGKHYLHTLAKQIDASFRALTVRTTRDVAAEQLAELKRELGSKLKVEQVPGRPPNLGARLFPGTST